MWDNREERVSRHGGQEERWSEARCGWLLEGTDEGAQRGVSLGSMVEEVRAVRGGSGGDWAGSRRPL